jgi:hypothetical protein
VPDIDSLIEQGMDYAEQKVIERLSEDYTSQTDQTTIDSRGWYGRCVYETDNDVCDNQVVTITWDDDFLPTTAQQDGRKGRGAKTATFHMIAFTADRTSHRRTRIYGARGEIVTDGKSIIVCYFPTLKYPSWSKPLHRFMISLLALRQLTNHTSLVVAITAVTLAWHVSLCSQLTL